jgi:pSer/pThr/pTyr-binding forkhead associated (FHA) protein
MPELSLEIVEGPNAGRRVSLSGPAVIGRAPDAGLVLDDDQASRHHARVTPQPDGTAVVEDLGSTNGTFINHAQLHGPASLHVGDDLLVGVTVVEMRLAAQIARQPSAVRPVPAPLAAAPQQPPFVNPAAPPEDDGVHELERLMDARTKLQARTAPLAIVVLAILVVAIYLGSR